MTSLKRKSQSSERFRHWAFTWNNYTESDLEEVKSVECTHLVVGEEVGESGTPHLQGQISFATVKSLKSLKKLWPKVHWEPTKDLEASITYCSKEGKVFSKGEKKEQGKRSDLSAAYAAFKGGKQLFDWAMEAEPSYQALKVFELLSRKAKPSDGPRTVKWFYGPTGTGKSREAHEAGAHFMSREGAFWSAYDGQEIVCLDDLRPGDLSRGHLLKILDRYPFEISIKGTTAPWRAKTIYITTPLSPTAFWSGMRGDDEADQVGQLLRRINEIREFTAS